MCQEHLAYQKHEHEGWKHEGKRGCQTTGYAHSHAAGGIVYGSVAAVCGAVDAYGTWSHLGYSYDIGELGRCQPMVVLYHFVLYE